MNPKELLTMARSLLDEHGLHDWGVVFTRSKNDAGACSYTHHHIRLSTPLAAVRSAEDTRQTILHEVAHALVGPGHNHDSTWRRQLLAIGGNGKTRWTDDDGSVAAIAKWIGTCPNGHQVHRHARSAKMYKVSCGLCSPRWSAQHLYTWVENTARTAAPGEVAVAERSDR